MKIAVFLLFALFCARPAAAQEVDEGTALEERMFIDNVYVPNYRELMRDIVVALSEFARQSNPDFKILALKGEDLLTYGQWESDLDELHAAEKAGAKTKDERFLLKLFSTEEPLAVGSPNRRYLQAIDGVVFENAFCGKNKIATPTEKLLKQYGIAIFSAEHCDSLKTLDAALEKAGQKKIAVHADTDKKASYAAVATKSKPHAENAANIRALKDVRNVRFVKNSGDFASKDAWVDALAATNYDLIAIDPFFRFNRPLFKEDVNRLKFKKLGARRLVFAVLNVAQAQDTRPYWNLSWKLKSPYWLRFPVANDASSVIVDYWNPEWKKIIGFYFKEIVDLGYDGVVLEGLNTHATYERIIPVN